MEKTVEGKALLPIQSTCRAILCADGCLQNLIPLRICRLTLILFANWQCRWSGFGIKEVGTILEMKSGFP
jgi:hypothetical protein